MDPKFKSPSGHGSSQRQYVVELHRQLPVVISSTMAHVPVSGVVAFDEGAAYLR